MTHDDTLKRAAEFLRESAHELLLSYSAPSSNYAFDSIVEPEVRADILEYRNLADALDALREELARQEPPTTELPEASPETKGICNTERACAACYSGQGDCEVTV